MKVSIIAIGLNVFPALAVNTKVARQNCPITIKSFSEVANAVSSSCKSIILDSIHIPAKQFIDLKKLKPYTVVTFAGTTTIDYYALKSQDDQSLNPIQIGGNYITVTAQRGAIFDGNGGAWWDGFGSNEPKCDSSKAPDRCKSGKVQRIYKPNYLIKFTKLDHSTVSNLYVKNYPVHGITVSNSRNLTIENIFLDNADGEIPNEKSRPLPAAHNSDGFGISNSTLINLRNSTVLNQDDCVAITSGSYINVSKMVCVGGHGLSIGSIGGKGDGDPYKNEVRNVIFSDSQLYNQQNGLRIKTNAGETGLVKNITFRNIGVWNSTDYGITIRQDYDNGGPTCEPSDGVPIQDITIENIVGTMSSQKKTARSVHILCGSSSNACSNFRLNNITITGGTSRCNYRNFGRGSMPFTCAELGKDDCK